MPFNAYIGNSGAVRTVREMLRTGRVPGTLLFTGPDGVGKKTLALMLAKALNCGRLRDDFCGQCHRCCQVDAMVRAAREDLARRRELKASGQRIEGLVYFDVQLIEPMTRFILSEQVRELRRIAYTRPFDLLRRVLIVDQVQTIHWQAVDVLLKVLEEPPETTIFILISPNAAELRPTIRSRARRIVFSPVGAETILQLLEEKSALPKAERQQAARLAAGSVAKALTFDPAAYARQIRPWLDLLDSVAADWSGGVAAEEWKQLIESARALSERHDEFEDVLKIGYSLLRDLLLMVEGAEESAVSHVDLLPRLKRWSRRLSLAEIERLKDGLDEAYRLRTRNVNQQLGFEALGIEVMVQRRGNQEDSISGSGPAFGD